MKPKYSSPFLYMVTSNAYKGWTGCVDIAKYFTENKEEINDRDVNEALLIAASSDNEYLVKYLCLQKVDINFANDVGDTALHIATRRGNEKTVQCLIEMGAEVGVLNSLYEAPLSIARSKILDKIVDELNEVKSSFSYPSSNVLNNIEALLAEPAKYRKASVVNNTILSSVELDTITKTDIEAARKADEDSKIRSAISIRKRVRFSDDPDGEIARADAYDGESDEEETILGMDIKPRFVDSPSLPLSIRAKKSELHPSSLVAMASVVSKFPSSKDQSHE